MSEPDLISAYLSKLATELRLPATERRRVLAEVEDHLREAVDRHQATPATEAQRDAIARFGETRTVARTYDDVVRRRMRAPIVLAVCMTVAAIGIEVIHLVVRWGFYPALDTFGVSAVLVAAASLAAAAALSTARVRLGGWLLAATIPLGVPTAALSALGAFACLFCLAWHTDPARKAPVPDQTT